MTFEEQIADAKARLAELRFQYRIATPRERIGIARKIGRAGKRLLAIRERQAAWLKANAAKIAEQRTRERRALQSMARAVKRARARADEDT